MQEHHNNTSKPGLFANATPHSHLVQEEMRVHPLIIAILESRPFSLELLRAQELQPLADDTQRKVFDRKTVFDQYQEFANRMAAPREAPDLSKNPLALILVIIAYSSNRSSASQNQFFKTPLAADAKLINMFDAYNELIREFNRTAGLSAPTGLELKSNPEKLAASLNLVSNPAISDALGFNKTTNVIQNNAL